MTGNEHTCAEYEQIDPKGKAFLKPAQYRRQPNPTSPAYPYLLNRMAELDGRMIVPLPASVPPPQPSAQPPLRPPAAPTMASASDNTRHLGDPQRGKYAMQQYLCITCHAIPGVTGADKQVGPPLAGMARRAYIGGVLVNTPTNMVRWLRNPQQIDPLSGMPNLHIREQDIDDIAAYLYTLR